MASRCACRRGLADRNALSQLGQEISHEGYALGECWCGTFDTHAIRSGEADASILLHEKDERTGVERRMLHELDRRALGPCVDLAHAERLGEEPQSMACEQRLRLLKNAVAAVPEVNE